MKMSTNIVYVLVSDESDFYLEQLSISVLSLRRHNPDAVVTILTDRQTYNGLTGNRRQFIDFINELKVVDTPSDISKKMRSRYIKTSIRELVDGTFLYMDVDTVICGSLAELDDCPFEIGACPDTGFGKSYKYPNPHSYLYAKQSGWDHLLENEPYFNGGVIYAKDSAAAHSLFREWHKEYLYCTTKEVFTDQTSLCMANKSMGYPVKYLDDKWNAHFARNMAEAVIIHYFYGHQSDYCIKRESVFMSVRQRGIDIPFIYDLLDNPRSFLVPAELYHFCQKYDILIKWYGSGSILLRIILKVATFMGGLTMKLKYRYD